MADEPASMRTALGRVRYLGSARSGTTAAWRMRLTSAALIPLTLAFVWLILSLLGKDYNAVRSKLGSPLPSILMLLFLLAAIYHMQIGMRSIIEDYVHSEHAKSWSLIANTFFAGCVGLACIYAVLRISFV